MSNKSLNNAIKMKYDEFYTQYQDIEKEVSNYETYFQNKIVYCNCDNMYQSNFPKFFILNFNRLKLRELIVSGLDSDSVYSISDVPEEFDGMEPSSFSFDDFIVFINKIYSQQELFAKEMEISNDSYPLRDFRSTLCTDLLNKCDIVCTNPPFSLFRDFIALMMQYKKKFLVIGNKNALTYKTIFPFVKNNQIWLGCNSVKKFLQPNGSFKTFGNVGWYTNIPVEKQNDTIVLTQHYYDENGNPLADILERYPKFDNYDAINVGKLKDIPMDYFGVMGVPITILDKYNPSTFITFDNDKKNDNNININDNNDNNDTNVNTNNNDNEENCSDGGQKITDFFTLSGQPSPKEKDLVVVYGQINQPNQLSKEIEYIKESLSNGNKDFIIDNIQNKIETYVQEENFNKNFKNQQEFQRNLMTSIVDNGETMTNETLDSLSGSVGKLFKIVGVMNHGCDHKWDLCKCTINGKEIFKRIAIQRR